MTLARFCLYGGGGGLVAKLCPTLCNSMDCSPPGSSVNGISQARILEWVASSFSRGSSQPRNRTHVSSSAGRFFTAEPPGKPFYPYRHYSNLFWWFFIISCPLEATVSLWWGHGLLYFPIYSPPWWSHPLWWLLMLFRSWTFISPTPAFFSPTQTELQTHKSNSLLTFSLGCQKHFSNLTWSTLNEYYYCSLLTCPSTFLHLT